MTAKTQQHLENPLPSSDDSERAILGSILLDNAVIAEAIEHLKPADFYAPLNRRVFAAMIALFERRQRIDPILIGEELKKENSLDSSGGISTITNLTFGLPHLTTIEEYIETVRDKSQKRTIIEELNSLTNAAISDKSAILCFSEHRLVLRE